MATYIGYMHGSRGSATQVSDMDEGLTVKACSHQGAVHVKLYRTRGAAQDYVRITFKQHQGAGRDLLLYRGPVDGSGMAALMQRLEADALEKMMHEAGFSPDTTFPRDDA